MTYMATCDSTTCDKFSGTTAKWFKIDQIGKKSDGTTWYQQDVSAYHSLLLPVAQLTNARKHGGRHSERQAGFCNAPCVSGSRRLPSPARDHRSPPSRDTRRSRVLPILHPNPRWRLPIWHAQPNRLLPGRIQRQRPRHLRSERVRSRSSLHIPWPAHIEPRVVRGHDWPVVCWERLVAGREFVSVVHGEEFQAVVHERCRVRCAAHRSDAVEPTGSCCWGRCVKTTTLSFGG